MTFVAQTCRAATSRLLPGVSWSVTRVNTSNTRVARLLVTTRTAHAREARLDHLVCRVIRHGLVAIKATSNTNSRVGVRNRGPITDVSGSTAYRAIATRTAMAGGIRASPRFPRLPSCLAWAWCAGGGSAIPCSSCPGVTTASPDQTADQNADSHAVPHPKHRHPRLPVIDH